MATRNLHTQVTLDVDSLSQTYMDRHKTVLIRLTWFLLKFVAELLHQSYDDRVRQEETVRNVFPIIRSRV